MVRQPRVWRPELYPGHEHKHPRDQRWRVQYEDPHNNYRRTSKGGFRRKADAEAWRRDFVALNARGEWTDPHAGDVTFKTVADEWLANHKTTKAKTRAGYKAIIKACPFRDVSVGSITYGAVRAWVAGMSATLKPSTVRNNFYVLSAVLDYAVDTDRLSRSPATKARESLPSLKPLHRAEAERYPLRPSDAGRIIAALPEPWDLYARLVYATGMRPEEATALRLCDVNTDRGVISINGVLVDVNGHLIREDNAKTARSIRRVELDPATTDLLAAYIAAHRRRAASFFTRHPEEVHPGETLPLFVGVGVGRAYGRPDIDRLDFTKPMRHGNFYAKHWKAAVRAARLPDTIRFYDLRHAHISWNVQQLGQPGALTLKEIQERAGHSSAIMTLDRYAHSPVGDVQRKRHAQAGLFPEIEQTNVVPLHG